MKKYGFIIIALFCMSAMAGDIVQTRSVGLELARDLASAALTECRKQGYQVTVAVVDKFGISRVILRDDLAPRFTVQIAIEKANISVISGGTSDAFVKANPNLRAELNHADGLLMMQGATAIVSGGETIGAIGVSGAPSEVDEVCAQKAVAQLTERLEFAD